MKSSSLNMSKNQGVEQWEPVQEDAVHNQSRYREKRTSVRARKGKNALISSAESTRVLRSRSQEKPKVAEPSSNLAEDTGNREKKRKKKEQVKNVSVDEFLRIKRNLSYLLSRIKYEETLIDAYSGEGWKGQSLEKIKPEKELQRAKSEIFRKKLKIRDLFQRLHVLCTEGRHPQSTGDIDSEDRVFPEAAAAAAAGKSLDENFGLPSDDSEDDDYDPDGPVLDEKGQGDESSSEESDSSSSSKDLKALPNDEQYLGLPSDDSEDDDFNPSELNEQVKQESSSSDFTSDSEDFSVAFDDKRPLSEVEEPESQASEYIKCNVEGDSAPLSGKRHVQRLDYKKLHDEEYGNASSDSSDEDYTDSDAPKKRENNRGKVASVSPERESERTPKRRTSKKLDVEGPSSSLARPWSAGKSTSKSTYKRLGETVTQRLSESFKENQYPDQAIKEELAKELGITAHQVNKWFVNTRWSFRHPSAKKLRVAETTSNNGT
ncbi:hypothetical protein LguiB_007032 [Lonicera macranthoides]